MAAGTAAGATTFLDPDAGSSDATFLQALGVRDVGDISSVPAAGLTTEPLEMEPIMAHDRTREGFADFDALGSSSFVDLIVGFDASAGIVGPDPQDSQAGIELQDSSGAISILDRLGSSLGQALGSTKRN